MTAVQTRAARLASLALVSGPMSGLVIFDRFSGFSRVLARNLVERFFNKIKHCRRVTTRYDKLAVDYLAFVQPASIRLWLRVNETRP
jgi:transposase